MKGNHSNVKLGWCAMREPASPRSLSAAPALAMEPASRPTVGPTASALQLSSVSCPRTSRSCDADTGMSEAG